MYENRIVRFPGTGSVEVTDPVEIESWLERLFELDGRSTKFGREGYVALQGPVRDFYREITARFAREAGGRLDAITVDGELMAALLSLQTTRGPFLLYIAHDQRIQWIGPGWLLLARLFRGAAEHGFPEMDLNGRTGHVREWGSRMHPIAKAVVYSPAVHARPVRLRECVLGPVRSSSALDWIPMTPSPIGAGGGSRAGARNDGEAPLPSRAQFYEDGRTALRFGLESLGIGPGDEVLFPSYHCGSELEVLLEAGANLRYYPVGRDLRVAAEAIEALVGPDTRALYVIHYLGWRHALAPLRALCDRTGLLLIEDSAQALYGPAPDADADLSIFSLHKFLPVLDGGAAVLGPGYPAPPRSGRRLGPADRCDLALRSASDRARHAGGRSGKVAALAAHAVRVGLARLHMRPAAGRRRISAVSLRRFQGTDHAAVAARRREHYERLAQAAQDLTGIETLFPRLDDAVPCLFPILADNPIPLVERLAQAAVEAGLHWSGVDPRFPLAEFADAVFLKAHLVVIPLHQQLGEPGLQRIIGALQAHATGSGHRVVARGGGAC